MTDDALPDGQEGLPSGLDLFAINPAFRNDPDAPLRLLRARCPVYQDESTKSLILTTYEDIRAVVNDRTLWRHPSRADTESLFHRFSPDNAGQDSQTESILFLDDPDHARVRQPLTQAFYKRASKVRGATERIVAEILDGLAGLAQVDIINDVGIPIPIFVIADILGVERERIEEFRAWSEGIILSLNAFRTVEESKTVEWARDQLRVFFLEEMQARRTQPRDDLLTDMVQLQAAGADLSDAEIAINCSALLVAGNLTTTDLIGNGVWLFLQHPDELVKLQADPALINAAVEEILRVEGPVVQTGRVASRAMEIAGRPVRQSTPISTYLRAANRDPGHFPDPDRFNITRAHAPHVSFGGGAHICIGAPLARLEAQVALAMLFARWPGMRLAQQELAWRALPGFRGLERLIVDLP
jgi:cytochrome P450